VLIACVAKIRPTLWAKTGLGGLDTQYDNAQMTWRDKYAALQQAGKARQGKARPMRRRTGCAKPKRLGSRADKEAPFVVCTFFFMSTAQDVQQRRESQ